MIREVYIDNYRGFSAFQLKLDRLCLLLGRNGSGKSSFLDVVGALRGFVCDQESIEVAFPRSSMTRWDRRMDQKFQLGVELPEGRYKYVLVVEHDPIRPQVRVKMEELQHDQKRIFLFEDGNAHLFNDHYEDKAQFPFDWSKSALALIAERPENQKLSKFKRWMTSIQFGRANPDLIPALAGEPATILKQDLSNFAAWLRGKIEENPVRFTKLIEELRSGPMPGLLTIGFSTTGGDSKELHVVFTSDTRSSEDDECRFLFGELSQGQKILIYLYALLHYCLLEEQTILLDEPDNFVALREVQPWLSRLQEIIDEGHGQAILVSHHPELLNQLANDDGIMFLRSPLGPVTSQPFSEVVGNRGESFSPSEAIARGWEQP